MPDCELGRYFRNSSIHKQYRFQASIPNHTTIIEFPSRYSDKNSIGKLRGDFLFYLRKLDRILENEPDGKNWNSTETYDHTRKAKKGIQE